MKYNYAQLDITLSKNDPNQILIETRVVTLGNHEILSKKFSVLRNSARKIGAGSR
jgi:hypothetical protein